MSVSVCATHHGAVHDREFLPFHPCRWWPTLPPPHVDLTTLLSPSSLTLALPPSAPPLNTPAIILTLFASCFALSSLLWIRLAFKLTPLTLIRLCAVGTTASLTLLYLLHSHTISPGSSSSSSSPFARVYGSGSSTVMSPPGYHSSSADAGSAGAASMADYQLQLAHEPVHSSSPATLLALALCALPCAAFAAASGPVLAGLNFLCDRIGRVKSATRIATMEGVRLVGLVGVLCLASWVQSQPGGSPAAETGE